MSNAKELSNNHRVKDKEHDEQKHTVRHGVGTEHGMLVVPTTNNTRTSTRRC
jgi:hypothetical protein